MELPCLDVPVWKERQIKEMNSIFDKICRTADKMGVAFSLTTELLPLSVFHYQHHQATKNKGYSTQTLNIQLFS